MLTASVNNLPTWKFIALWVLLVIFVMLASGAVYRFRKYRRLDDLFHCLAYCVACLWGFCQGILLPFLIGLGTVLLVRNIDEYRRKTRDNPTVEEISRSFLDDAEAERRERRRSKI